VFPRVNAPCQTFLNEQYIARKTKKISLSSLNGSNFLLLLFFSVVVKIQKSKKKKKKKNELFEETLLCIVLTLKIGIFIEAAATCSRFIFLRGGFRV
jgi:Ca2+/Na+ antiporter